MKLGLKILLPLLGLTCVILFSFLYILHDLQIQEASILKDLGRIEELNSLNNRLVQVQNFSDSSLLSYRFTQNVQYLNDINDAQIERAQILDKMSPLSIEPQRRELIRRYIDERKPSDAVRGDFIAAVVSQNSNDITRNFEKWKVLNQTIQAALTDLDQYNVNSIYTSVNKVKDIRTDVSRIIFIIIFLLLLCTTFIYAFIQHSVVAPLQKIGKTADEVIKGHLHQRVEYSSRDEIGTLASTFNLMTTQLSKSYENLEEKVKTRTKELTESEKKLAVIVDNLAEGLVVVDVNGKFTHFNKAAEEMLGVGLLQSSPEEWSKIYSVYRVDKVTPFPTDELPLVRGMHGESTSNVQMFINNPHVKGGLFLEVSCRPLLNSKNEVFSSVAVFRDITKQLELDQAKTDFVSLASHQLRTPPTAIRWNAELLLDDTTKLDIQQRRLVTNIYTANDRMIKLIDALLNTSRMDLGTFSVSPEEIDIKASIESILNEMTYDLEKKKLHATTHFSLQSPLLYADKNLFEIVIQNLLANSVKYTPDSGSIIISAESDDHVLKLSVADTGYGIPKAEQNQIFKKLFRAANVTNKDTNGTGLGLYLVKSIIEYSKGKIWFESEENKGTTFYVTLDLNGMVYKEGSTRIS